MESDASHGASRQLFGRGSIYTLATAAPALAGVLILPVATRFLPQDQYGLVSVSLVLIQFGTIVAASGLAISIMRHALLEASALEGARGLVVGSLGTGGLVLLVAASTGTWWSDLAVGQPWSRVLFVAVLAAGASGLLANAQAYFRAVDRAWTYVVLASAGTLVGPALGILAVVTMGRTALWYVAGLAVAYGIAATVGVALVMRSGPVHFRMPEFKRALRIGLPIIPHQLAISLALGSMIVIASHQLGLEGSARVQVALYVAMIPTVITSSLNNAWVPLIMRAPKASRLATLTRTSRDVGWIAAAGGAGVSLLSPVALRLAAPASYRPDELVPTVAVASLVAIISVMYLSNSHLIYVAGRTGGFAIVTPTSVACGMAVAALVVKSWGPVGAATGFVTTYAVLAALTMLLSRRVSEQYWVPWTLWGPAVLAALGSGAGALLPQGVLGLGVRSALALAVAAFAAVRMIRILRAPAAAEPTT